MSYFPVHLPLVRCSSSLNTVVNEALLVYLLIVAVFFSFLPVVENVKYIGETKLKK